MRGVSYDAPILHHSVGFGGMAGKTVDRKERIERCLVVAEFLLERGADPTIRVNGKDAARHGASKRIREFVESRAQR